MTFDKRNLFISLLAFRLGNALVLKTYFQPDEFWQGLEPAHQIVFGYGYLTWEWRTRLRSIAHPLLFAGVYKVSEILGLGYDGIIYGPKIVQAFFAAIADYSLYSVARDLYGYQVSRLALFCSVTSAFNFFVSTRTFSNSLEMSLLILALRYWPVDGNFKELRLQTYTKSLVLAAIACVLRPTNALIWIYLGVVTVWRYKSWTLVFTAAVTGIAVVTLCTLLDMWYYSEVTFPVLNFIRFNVVESLSSFYGVNRKLYYFIEALPQLLVIYLPFFIHGSFIYRSSDLVMASIFVVLAYSLIAHKEVRFIFPLLPIFHLISARSLYKLRILEQPRLKYTLYCAILLINIPLALYAGLVHQRGVVDVVQYIHSNREVTSVGFLMPCHSTPWMSHIHRPDITAWFLTCEPPSSASELATYRDEADQFYDDPHNFLKTYFPPLNIPNSFGSDKFQWPSHLILFGAHENIIKDFVGSFYTEEARFFNTHVHEDSRRKGDIIVLKRTM
ncbi:Alg9-like mannosyltransferase family-domain-containing protein [Dipodascopsis uninucleata]